MVRIIALLTALVVPMTVACADDKVEAKPDKANERTVILQLTHVTAGEIVFIFGGTGTGLPGGDPTHGRREFLRARLVRGDDGPVAERFAADGAGILTSMVEADGLVEIEEDRERLGEGDMVDFLPFNEVAR